MGCGNGGFNICKGSALCLDNGTFRLASGR